jgi:hypothetical protein
MCKNFGLKSLVAAATPAAVTGAEAAMTTRFGTCASGRWDLVAGATRASFSPRRSHRRKIECQSESIAARLRRRRLAAYWRATALPLQVERDGEAALKSTASHC